MSHRARIKDIAQRLNISTSTVSRALKGHNDVSENTRLRVEQLARQLNYHPDPVALWLKQQRTSTLGVIVPQLMNAFFSRVLAGIQEVANHHQYNVLIAQSNESAEQEAKNVASMIDNRVDGLMISLSRQTSEMEHFARAKETNTPLLFFDRTNDVPFPKVTINNREASYQAVTHLIEQGCRRIAYMAGPQNLSISQQRLAGYQQALFDYDLFVDKRYITFSYGGDNHIEHYVKEWLALDYPPDAIFAINDAAAIQTIHYLKKHGQRVPDDIAVVGFNNEEMSQFYDPPLTSVHTPAYELGKTTTQLLIKKLQTPEWVIPDQVLQSRLIVRQSSLYHRIPTVGR